MEHTIYRQFLHNELAEYQPPPVYNFIVLVHLQIRVKPLKSLSSKGGIRY